MRRLVALTLLLTLVACTGTFEIRPPILLVISFNDEDGPALALVRDNFATGPSGTARELTFIEASRRALPAGAVAFDVVDRAGRRPTLVVLSRDPSAPHTAYLRGYALAGIDPDAPAAFAEDGNFTRDLTALLRDQPELADDADYCLVDVQVSSSGRYLALLEDRSACGSDDLVAVYVLDLRPNPDKPEEVSLVAAVDTEPLVAVGLHLDQQLDRLYFISEGISDASLESLAVSTGSRSVVAEIDGQAQVDLARVAAPSSTEANELLVALSDSSFQTIDTEDDPATTGTPISSESGARALIHDPFERSEKLLILGGSRFTVHQSVDDGEGRSVSVAAASGTFQPEDLFVYLASEGRLFIFDALVDDGSGVPTLASFDLPELIKPGPMTWLRGADAPP